MKTTTHIKKESRIARFPNKLKVKNILLSALFLTAIQTSLVAQTPVKVQEPKFKQPSWWFGVAGGANFNFYDGSTQKLNSDLSIPVPFHNGNGIGVFVGPLIEFHRAESMWGFMLQGFYDNRSGSFETTKSPCNCPNDLKVKMNYVAIEPSLRFMPFKGKFYMFAGPRISYNLDKSFTYQLGVNPDYPEQVLSPEVKGDLSDVNQTVISMQVGAGYDIPLSSKTKQNQVVFSPFVSFIPYVGQSPRSIETWNVTTLRGGAALKFGHGRKISVAEPTKFDSMAVAKAPVKAIPVESKPNADSIALAAAALANADVIFTVNSPKNTPVENGVTETFPIRNYVYFDLGTTKIPARYVLLEKSQTKDFKENHLANNSPKTMTGRSERQMNTYYNVLNILGDRMVKKPTTTIKLVGSSIGNSAEGEKMAESVKKYLVDVFEINPSRITTVGNTKPETPSLQPGGKNEIAMLSESDRRVSIETTSPTLLMQFQNGPDAPLMPVVLGSEKEAPLESYVSFNTVGGKDPITTWSVEAKDENGIKQYYGPFTDENKSIAGKDILGTRAEGDYKITMTAQTKSGKTIVKETTSHIVLWTPPKNDEELRFSVIFDFNKSKATEVYRKYLTNIVTPKIPKNSTVVINGYSDVIGQSEHNLILSQARANEVGAIIKSALANSGRSDVKFKVNGSGEDEKLTPFNNKYPEERSYNRTVVIDIIPTK